MTDISHSATQPSPSRLISTCLDSTTSWRLSGTMDSKSPVHYLTELIQNQTPISLPVRHGIVSSPAKSTPLATSTTWNIHYIDQLVLYSFMSVHTALTRRADRVHIDLIFSFEQARLAGWLQTDIRLDNVFQTPQTVVYHWLWPGRVH